MRYTGVEFPFKICNIPNEARMGRVVLFDPVKPIFKQRDNRDELHKQTTTDGTVVKSKKEYKNKIMMYRQTLGIKDF